MLPWAVTRLAFALPCCTISKQAGWLQAVPAARSLAARWAAPPKTRPLGTVIVLEGIWAHTALPLLAGLLRLQLLCQTAL